MENQRNTQMMKTPPRHYAIGTGAGDAFQYLPPWAVNYDQNQLASNSPLSIDVDESVSNMFSTLNISSTNNYNCRTFLPETFAGEIGGAGSPIGIGEGSVHPFRSDIAFDESFRGLNAANSRRRFLSSVGQCNHFTVDPHPHHHSLWQHNRDVNIVHRFDQPLDFDQMSDLLHKESHLYYKQHLNPHFLCSPNSPAAIPILDETYLPNTIHNSNFSRSVNDNANVNGKLCNYQLLSLLSLKELRGNIHTLAKDQNGCRLLQAKFENPTNEEIEIVLYEVLDSITDLMKDQFGNYLIQKLIVVCNDDHKLRILVSLTDVPVEMVLVCMSPHGTRAMQKLLENLTDPYQIALTMAALRPAAARLANDPNGHHVIQYCLIHFQSDVNEAILNEIAHKCYEIATDRSGCCVLQACIEHSHGPVRNRLVSEVLSNALHLAEDPYGNYVLQHMLGLNVREFTAQLVRQLQGNFAHLSCNKYASNVVEKCLNQSGQEISTLIVMELITSQNPSLLLIDPYANFVIQSALTVSTGLVYECLLELISDNMSCMRTNLYGKKILAWFEKRKILGI